MQLSSYRDKLSELNDAEQFGVVVSFWSIGRSVDH